MIKKTILAILLFLWITPAYSTDFADTDQVYGWNGTAQFYQTWANHKAQIFGLFDTQAEFETLLFPFSSFNLKGDHNSLLFNDGVPYNTLFQTKLTIITGAKTLLTTALAANTCRTETDTATGAVSTDIISGNFNASVNGIAGYGALATDGMKIMAYPTTDTVNFEVCNGTSAEIAPGARTINWQIIK